MAVRAHLNIKLLGALVFFAGMLNIATSSVSQTSGFIFNRNSQFKDALPPNTTQIHHEMVGREACATLCSGLAQCASFFWTMPNKCQLHSVNLDFNSLNNEGKLKESLNTEYFISNKS